MASLPLTWQVCKYTNFLTLGELTCVQVSLACTATSPSPIPPPPSPSLTL